MRAWKRVYGRWYANAAMTTNPHLGPPLKDSLVGLGEAPLRSALGMARTAPHRPPGALLSRVGANVLLGGFDALWGKLERL